MIYNDEDEVISSFRSALKAHENKVANGANRKSKERYEFTVQLNELSYLDDDIAPIMNIITD